MATTNEAGDTLDLAVARAEIARGQLDIKISDAGQPTIQGAEGWHPFRPSIDAGQGWTIIEREWPRILMKLREVRAGTWGDSGDQLLIDFLRAYLEL